MKLTARDILDQFFIDDSDFPGSDSDREEGEDIHVYQGSMLDASTLREEA